MFVIPSTPEGSMVKIRLVLGSLQCQIEIWLSLVSPVLYHTPFASQLSIYYYYFVIVFFFLLSLSLKGSVLKKKNPFTIVVVGFLEGIQLDASVKSTIFIPRSPG